MPELLTAGLRTRFVAASPDLLEAARPVIAALIGRLLAEDLALPRGLVVVGHDRANPDNAGQLVMTRRNFAWAWMKAGLEPERLAPIVAHELGHLALAAGGRFVAPPEGAIGHHIAGEWMAEAMAGELLAEAGLPASPFDLDGRAAEAFGLWTYLKGKAALVLPGTVDEQDQARFRRGLWHLARMWAYAQGRRTFADANEPGEWATSATELTEWIGGIPLVSRLIEPIATAPLPPTLVERFATLALVGEQFDAVLFGDVSEMTAELLAR
jgi:hypothetical protein